MGFNRYRCILDRIFSFSKLPEYRRRFHFRKYRTAFVFDEKNVKVKVVESFTDRFRPFSSLLPSLLCSSAGLATVKKLVKTTNQPAVYLGF